jgi:hypothetical protein
MLMASYICSLIGCLEQQITAVAYNYKHEQCNKFVCRTQTLEKSLVGSTTGAKSIEKIYS